jgi:hypothetical protein
MARHLVLVVDERFADAAGLLRDALGAAGVELELIMSPDPGGAARARIEASQQLDAALTDENSIGPITDIGGFGDVISL